MSRFNPWILPVWALSLAIAGVVGIAGAFADDEKPPKLVAAADAKSHIDERCTVEMKFLASKDAGPRRENYLDSEEDFHDEKNFAVVISYDHAERKKKAGIDNPADYYMGEEVVRHGEGDRRERSGANPRHRPRADQDRGRREVSSQGADHMQDIALASIEDARRKIAGTALRTPLVRLNGIDMPAEI